MPSGCNRIKGERTWTKSQSELSFTGIRRRFSSVTRSNAFFTERYWLGFLTYTAKKKNKNNKRGSDTTSNPPFALWSVNGNAVAVKGKTMAENTQGKQTGKPLFFLILDFSVFSVLFAPGESRMKKKKEERKHHQNENSGNLRTLFQR